MTNERLTVRPFLLFYANMSNINWYIHCLCFLLVYLKKSYVFNRNFIIIYPLELFPSALADGFSLEFEW